MKEIAPTSRGEDTRAALVQSALEEFARRSFDAVSTREIAERASVNQALIAYHFRGKEGLYLAVIEHISAQIRGRMAYPLEALNSRLAELAGGRITHRQRAEVLESLLKMLDGMVALFADDAAASWAQLIMREQQAPSPAFERLFEGFMGPVLGLLTRTVTLLRRTPGDERDDRLLVITMLGQVLALRAAHAGVLRHLGCTTLGPIEVAAIQRRIRENVTAILLN